MGRHRGRRPPLRRGRPLRDGWATQGYCWIVYRLSQCADPTVTVQAINASNWCRGCTNGRYVIDTLPFVENDYAGYAER